MLDSVGITLDRERRVRFTNKALKILQERYDKPVFKLAEIMDQDVRVEDVETFLWAGLTWEDKALTEEQTSDLLELTVFAKAIETIQKALFLAWGVDEDEVGEDVKNQIAVLGTGETPLETPQE